MPTLTNKNLEMKKITLLCALLLGSIAFSQTTQLAKTDFEEPTLGAGNYTDTGDASVAHDLLNNVDEPSVNFAATATEIGFAASYIPYDVPGVGLTDGDYVGVTDFTGDVTTFTSGTQGYQLSDLDGTMTVVFDAVDFTGYENNTVSIDYFINDTGYEGDGTTNDDGNDLFRIFVRDLTNNTETDILITLGSDINDLMIENSWITGTATIADGANVELVVQARTNSGSETLMIDTISFEGEVATVVLPQLEITEIFSGQSGDDLTADWFEIKNTGTTDWISGVDGDLYYDDESADETTADIISGLTTIPAGETVIVLVTGDIADVDVFTSIWGSVIDLSSTEVGFTDGAGLGGGGDAVNLWIGLPTLINTPVNTGVYPDTSINDGQSFDVELGVFSVVGNVNGAVETIATAGSAGDVPNIGSPGNGVPVTISQVAFNTSYISVNENDGAVNIAIEISEMPTINTTVDVSLVGAGTAVDGADFTFGATQTVSFLAGSMDDQILTINIADNTIDNSDRFFVLQIENPTNAELGIQQLFTVYILDDDTQVPAEDTTQLDASLLSSYLVDADGTAEIVAYDTDNQQLFVVNDSKINILDFTDPANITETSFIDVTSIGASAQSVAVQNGLVAIAVANNDPIANGFVVFRDALGVETPVVVEIGVLPDMLVFSPDGTKLLVANEGQPNDDYSVDPEGSVAIIDITGGLSAINQTDVTLVNFNSYDGQEAALNASGIRVYGPGATASQDFEPEYIAVSDNSETAYVVLQENNAYAIIDIASATVTDVKSFGLKNHSLQQNSIDVSNDTDFVFNANWPIKGMYMPDAISYYSVGGVDYIVTANEGDAREYDAFEEEVKIGDSNYTLDPAVFSDLDILELESNLGSINVTSASGDTDNNGLFEEIHIFGGRSFSIFEAATGTLVFDSAHDFEVITANHPIYGAIFNASNSNNNLKNRSDNKGPEPEGVLVKEIEGQFYAFVLLERIGGVMIYNITDPTTPQFLQYLNNRDVTPGGDEMGDLGPEGLAFVSAEESATGTAYIVVANEVSATLSVYALNNVVLGLNDFTISENNFALYPNPANGDVFFSTPGNYKVYDMLGRNMLSVTNAASLNVASLPRGTYIVKSEKGISQKLLVE